MLAGNQLFIESAFLQFARLPTLSVLRHPIATWWIFCSARQCVLRQLALTGRVGRAVTVWVGFVVCVNKQKACLTGLVLHLSRWFSLCCNLVPSHFVCFYVGGSVFLCLSEFLCLFFCFLLSFSVFLSVSFWVLWLFFYVFFWVSLFFYQCLSEFVCFFCFLFLFFNLSLFEFVCFSVCVCLSFSVCFFFFFFFFFKSVFFGVSLFFYLCLSEFHCFSFSLPFLFCFGLYLCPDGRPGMSDVSHLSWISGLSFDFLFLSPLVFFCIVLLLFLSCNFSANGPFSAPPPPSPPPPPPLPRKFSNYFSLRDRLFFVSLDEQLGDGMGCVRLAAIWCWYLPWWIDVICLKSLLLFFIP